MDDLQAETDVNSIYKLLKITKLENEELVVDYNSIKEVVSKGKSCLLLRLLTTQYYNREAFKNTMRRVWCPIKALRFYKMGNSPLMAKFKQHNDKLKIMHDGP